MLFKNTKESHEIELLKTQSAIDLSRAESKDSAKEVASKYIGKNAFPWIVVLVVVGVGSAAFMPVESLPAIIGLVSTAVMGMIGMLNGITGNKDRENEPEVKIIDKLLARLEEKDRGKIEDAMVESEDLKEGSEVK